MLVMGGFHLLRTGKKEVNRIAGEFHDSGITYAAPTHCSGDGTLEEFRKVFGDRFLTLGAGRVVDTSEL